MRGAWRVADKTPGPALLWQYKDGNGLEVPCRCGANAFKPSTMGSFEDGWDCTSCGAHYGSMEEIRSGDGSPLV
jgi:hypothetical protein